jgi:spoIIIJ-associated protein
MADFEEEIVDNELEEVEEVEEVEETSEDVFEGPAEFAEIARKYKAHESLSDEDLDLIADTSIEVLRTLLGFFGADGATIDEYDGGDGELIFDVSNADLALLIGRHGKTLESLQYIFSAIVHNKLGFKFPVVVDIESYKSRRRAKLEAIAKSGAARAIQRKQEIRLHPMKSYERKVVHLTLRNNKNVVTHSEGQEPNRCVVIVPVSKKQDK